MVGWLELFSYRVECQLWSTGDWKILSVYPAEKRYFLQNRDMLRLSYAVPKIKGVSNLIAPTVARLWETFTCITFFPFLFYAPNLGEVEEANWSGTVCLSVRP